MESSTNHYDIKGRTRLLELARQSKTFRILGTYAPEKNFEGIRSLGFRIQVPAQGPDFLLFTGHVRLSDDDLLFLSGTETGWSSPSLMNPDLYQESLTVLSPKLLESLTDDLVARLDAGLEPVVSVDTFAEVFGD